MLKVQTQNLLTTLRDASSRIDTATARLSTGNRLSSANDDPTNFAMAAAVKTTISSQAIDLNTISVGMGRIEDRDAVLASVLENLQHFKEVAMAGSGISDFASISPSLVALQEAAVNMANSSDTQGYMLSGTSNTMPFSYDPVTKTTTYNGNTTNHDVTVQGITLSGAVDGTPLMQMFNAMSSIITSSQAGTATSSSQIQALDNAVDALLFMRSSAAGQYNAGEEVQSVLTGRQDLYSARLQDMQSADLASESAMLSQNQTQRQATLQVLSMQLGAKHLMDYL